MFGLRAAQSEPDSERLTLQSLFRRDCAWRGGAGGRVAVVRVVAALRGYEKLLDKVKVPRRLPPLFPVVALKVEHDGLLGRHKQR